MLDFGFVGIAGLAIVAAANSLPLESEHSAVERPEVVASSADPIVPKVRWIVTRASGADEEQLLTQFALEPDAPLPTKARPEGGAGRSERDARSNSSANSALPLEWLAVESAEPEDALLAFTTLTSDADDVRRTGVTRAGKRIEGEDLFGWFVHENDDVWLTYSVAFSTSPAGARAASLLHPIVHGVESAENALYRRDASAPQGRRRLAWTGE